MAHTKIRLHIVTATKHREPLLTPEVEAYFHEILPAIVERLGGHLFAVNGVEDHTHMLVGLKPTIAPSTFMRDVKGESSQLIRNRFPDVGFRWQRSFSAFSVNPWRMRQLFDYIRNQKEHHASDSAIADWELAD